MYQRTKALQKDRIDTRRGGNGLSHLKSSRAQAYPLLHQPYFLPVPFDHAQPFRDGRTFFSGPKNFRVYSMSYLTIKKG